MLFGVGQQEHFFSDLLVVDVALDIAPALHLREHPHRHALPGHGVEVGTVRHIFDVAQAVSKLAGEHLVEHGFGLVEVLRWCDHLGYEFAVLGVACHGGRGQHSTVQRGKGVGVFLDELGAGAKGAAGVAIPQVFGKHVDKTGLFVDRALVERIGAEEAVDVARAQVGHHFSGWQHAQLHIGVGVQACFSQVVAQQEVVHAVFKRDGKLETFPALGVAVALVLDMQRDRLAIGVLNRGHIHVDLGRAQTHGHGNRHGRQKVRRVMLLVDHLVANQCPACGFVQLDIQTLFFIKAQRVGHDEG